MEYPSYRSFLIHHGRKGQRWGVQNGPPYPLGMSNKKYKRLTKLGISPYDKEETDLMRKEAKESKSVEDRIRERDEMTRRAEVYEKDVRKYKKFDVAVRASTLRVITASLEEKEVIDAMRARSKDRKTEQRILKNENIDPDTGLRLKQGEWTPEKDVKEINPGYRSFDPSYKQNCMFCTTAFDLRRRGYDVMAARTPQAQEIFKLSLFYPKSELHLVEPGTTKGDLPSVLEKELISQGNGARGNLMIAWKLSSGGHSVAYEIQNDRLIIYDGQSGEVIKKPKKLLKRGSMYQYARLDNIDFDKKQIREAVRP